MKERIAGLAHCCHHDIHWEFCFDFDERVEYIKRNKPENEQGLRLALFQIIPDEMIPGRDSAEWKACHKAAKVYLKATEASYKATDALLKKWGESSHREAYIIGWDAFYEATDACYNATEVYTSRFASELSDLHARLFPDCPFNNNTIFKGVEMNKGTKVKIKETCVIFSEKFAGKEGVVHEVYEGQAYPNAVSISGVYCAFRDDELEIVGKEA